jgi:hypothetical protein
MIAFAIEGSSQIGQVRAWTSSSKAPLLLNQPSKPWPWLQRSW